MKSIFTLIFSLSLLTSSTVWAHNKYNFETSKTEELRKRDGLPNFFHKLKAGKDVKVGYIGGSITNGSLWRAKCMEWLKSEYPKANITQVNAAIGGTGPAYGAYKIQNHLLVHNPDMVFVDITPTILSAAGANLNDEKFTYLDGLNMADVVAEKALKRDYVVGESHAVTGPRAFIRTKDYVFSIAILLQELMITN
jgi:hypothetical protein